MQPQGRLQRKLGGNDYASSKLPSTASTSVRHSSGIGSIAGGILGGVAGTALLPGLGTVGGGAAGSALGEALDQLLTSGHLNYQDIGKEGAIGLAGGVAGKALGLGVKGLKAAQGMNVIGKAAPKAGTALEQAVLDASPQTGKVASALSKAAPTNVLNGIGDNLAVRSIRATPSQLTAYAKTTGEDITKTLARHGLQGADAEKIAKTIQPLQEAYDSMALNAGISVPKSQIQAKLAEKLAPFLKSGASDDKAMAQQLKDEVSGLLKANKGSKINLADLTTQRRRYDDLTKTFKNDAFGETKNRSVGTILREVVQDAANGSGLKDQAGRSLKETGRELQRLIAVRDIAEKQANLGRGSLPLGITSLLGGGIGTGVGGPGGGLAGALLGAAATKAVNSPTLIGAASKTATAAAKGLSNPLVGKAGQAIAAQATGHAVGNPALQAMGLSAAPQTPPQPPQGSALEQAVLGATPTDPNAPAASPQSGNVFTPEVLQALALNDIQKTGGKNLNSIATLDKLFGSGSAKAPKPLSAEASKQVANAKSGLRAIDQLSSALKANPDLSNKNAVAGLLGNIGQGAAGTQGFEAAKNEIIDVISRSRSGAALTASEIANYKRALPRFGDSPDIARQKLARFQTLFEDILGNQQQGSPDLQSLAQ